MVRLVVARGAPATRIVVVEPLPEAGGDKQTALTRPYAGYRLPVPSVKTTSYLPSLQARREARALGVDELLLLDGDEVIEGATSNVFLVTGGRLVTPADDGRLLAGVTRARTIAHAREQGLAVEERAVRGPELHEADEGVPDLDAPRREGAGRPRRAPLRRGRGGSRHASARGVPGRT